MCFDHDSRPPIPPIEGGSLDAGPLALTSDDGTGFGAFRARPAEPSGTGIVVLPDVRGLHPYYEDLALRFAEHGVEAIAIDWFGRTAGVERRDASFDHAAHVPRTTFDGMSRDLTAAAAWLRSTEGGSVERLFVVGFCFGGRFAFLAPTLGLDLAGAIGFYGVPVGTSRNDMPPPVDVADRMRSPILGLFGGADPGIPPASIGDLETALRRAGVPHRIVVYPEAPHGFFDRKADEYVRSSEAAWAEVLAFLRSPTSATAAESAPTAREGAT